MRPSVAPAPPPRWEDQVKAQIRRRYARIAEVGFGPPGSGGRAGQAGYPTAFLADLPEAVIDAYCGCGNPLGGAVGRHDLAEVRVAVDLGCGAGIDARQLARLLPAGSLIIGIDMTQAMASLANTGPVRAVAADMEGLPLADAAADLVIANASFNLTTDQRLAFSEAHRVLKPGGRLVIRELIRDGELPVEVREDPQAWNTSLGGVLGEQELLASLTQAGFTAPRISDRRPFPPVTSIRLEAMKPT